ncbi:sodium-dependent lysophosphatidylcholine symporter 1-like [Mustelus asterias]
MTEDPEAQGILAKHTQAFASHKHDCGRITGEVIIEGPDPKPQRQYGFPKQAEGEVAKVISSLLKQGVASTNNSPIWPTETTGEHLKLLDELLNLLTTLGLKVNPKKTQIMRRQVSYLGTIVTEGKHEIERKRIESVTRLPLPKDVSSLHSFLGLVGYCRNHIDGFATKAAFLSELLWKNTPSTRFTPLVLMTGRPMRGIEPLLRLDLSGPEVTALTYENAVRAILENIQAAQQAAAVNIGKRKQQSKTYFDGKDYIKASAAISTDADKLRVLRGRVSDVVYATIQDTENYTTAIDLLKGLYNKRPNEVYARHLLAMRRRQPGESVDQFLRTLHLLARDCNCRSVTATQYTDNLIRDAFVTGIGTTYIRQQLLEQGALDSKKTAIGKKRERIALEEQKGKEREITRNLTMCNKLCFAIGGAPYMMVRSTIGFFLQIYLLDVVQITPFHASLVVFVGRTWDSITDPAVGYLINKSKWTKIGRLMPWIIGSAPFAVVSYILLWYVPPLKMGKMFWYMFFYSVFQTLLTCFHVPYSALVMFLSSDQKERDSATAYRMTMEAFGSMIGAAIQGQIIAHGHDSTGCFLHNTSADSSVNSTDVSSLPRGNMSTWQPQGLFSHLKNSYIIAAGVIGGIYTFCTITLFFGVKERDDPYTAKSDKPIPFLKGIKHVVRHSPYVKLITAFLFTSLAIKLLEGNFALFCSYAADLRHHFQYIVLTILVSAVVTIPFWQWFLQRFGKKTAVFCGMSWIIPFLIMMVSIPRNLILSYVVAISSGLSIASHFLLPWSMLPDVVDDFRLQCPYIKGVELIFCSFYVFFTKLSAGVSLGFSTLSLDFAGYETGACFQPPSVAFTLKLLVGAAPTGLIIIGLLIFQLYPITEEVRMKNKLALHELR